MSLSKTYTLHNGNKIPVVGFGTWQTPDGEVAESSVAMALKSGYTHIDTAMIYKNEESVGKAIRNSGIPRDNLFIATKLWNSDHSYEKAKKAIDLSLQRLGVDYLDLYLIHWPNPVEFRDNWAESNAEAWRAMEEAVEMGKIKNIGVSNFQIHHLEALFKTAKMKPVINQIFLNPGDQQKELVEYCQKENILLEAYSPLGTGKLLKLDILSDVAKRYDKTVAQIALKWSLQKGFLPLPKSVTPERIAENIELFDFEISQSDMMLIDSLQGQSDLALNADTANF